MYTLLFLVFVVIRWLLVTLLDTQYPWLRPVTLLDTQYPWLRPVTLLPSCICNSTCSNHVVTVSVGFEIYAIKFILSTFRPSFVPGAPPPQWRAPPTYFTTPTGYHPHPSKDAVVPPFRDHSQSPPIKRVTKSGKKG